MATEKIGYLENRAAAGCQALVPLRLGFRLRRSTSPLPTRFGTMFAKITVRIDSYLISVRSRTMFSMRRAASAVSSCSQTRMTTQPSSSNLRFVSRSRRRLVSIFSRQNSALAFGQVACSGQPCQKQPSTNTATLAREKTMSARRRTPRMGETSTRNRSPRRCNNERMSFSGLVSRLRLARMRFRASMEEAWGTPPRRLIE